jgi:hypothetical protein
LRNGAGLGLEFGDANGQDILEMGDGDGILSCTNSVRNGQDRVGDPHCIGIWNYGFDFEPGFVGAVFYSAVMEGAPASAIRAEDFGHHDFMPLSQQ